MDDSDSDDSDILESGLPVLVKVTYEHPTPKLALSLGDNKFVFRKTPGDDGKGGKGGGHGGTPSSRLMSGVGVGKCLKLFLPGRAAGDVFCTFSVLFDGSILLTKAFNGLPEIYVNGNRVPADSPIGLYSRDVIILGSLEYAYVLDLDSSDEQDGAAWLDDGRKDLDDVASEVLLGGDLDFRFEDLVTGQLMTIGRDRARTVLGISIFAFQAQELVEWVRWLGLAAQHIVKVDEEQKKVDLLIRTTLDLVNVQNAVKLEGGNNFHSTCGMSFESSILHSYGSNKDGEEKSLNLTALEGIVLFAQAIEKVLGHMTLMVEINHKSMEKYKTGSVDGKTPNGGSSSGGNGGGGTGGGNGGGNGGGGGPFNTDSDLAKRSSGVDFSALNGVYSPILAASGAVMANAVGSPIFVEAPPATASPESLTLGSLSEPRELRPGPEDDDGSTIITSRGTVQMRSSNVTASPPSTQHKAFPKASTAPAPVDRDLTAAVVRGCFDLLYSGGRKRQQTKKWVRMCAELLLPLCLFVEQGAATDAATGAGAATASAASSAAGGFRPPPGSKYELGDYEAAFAEVLMPYWGAPQCKESRLVQEQVITASIQCIMLLSVRHLFNHRRGRQRQSRTTLAKSTTVSGNPTSTLWSWFGLDAGTSDPMQCVADDPAQKKAQQEMGGDVPQESFDDLRCLLRICVHIPEKLLPAPPQRRSLAGQHFIDMGRRVDSPSHWSCLYNVNGLANARSDVSDLVSLSNASDDTPGALAAGLFAVVHHNHNQGRRTVIPGFDSEADSPEARRKVSMASIYSDAGDDEADVIRWGESVDTSTPGRDNGARGGAMAVDFIPASRTDGVAFPLSPVRTQQLPPVTEALESGSQSDDDAATVNTANATIEAVTGASSSPAVAAAAAAAAAAAEASADATATPKASVAAAANVVVSLEPRVSRLPRPVSSASVSSTSTSTPAVKSSTMAVATEGLDDVHVQPTPVKSPGSLQLPPPSPRSTSDGAQTPVPGASHANGTHAAPGTAPVAAAAAGRPPRPPLAPITPTPAPAASPANPAREQNLKLLRANEAVLWDIFYFYCLKQTGAAAVPPISLSLPKDKRHARRMLSVDSLSTIMRDFGVCPGLCGHTQLKELAAQAAALPRDRDGGEPTGTAGATTAAAAGARTPNSPAPGASPGGRGGNGSPAPPTLSFNSFVKVLLAVAEDISLPPCAEPRDPRDPTAAIVLKVMDRSAGRSKLVGTNYPSSSTPLFATQ